MAPAGNRAGEPGLSRAFVEHFSRQRREPDWLREARLAAWERYEAMPKPTNRDLGWRRTDLSALDLDRLAPPLDSAPQGASGDLRALADGDGEERAGLLALRNGEVHHRSLDPKLAQRGVHF